MSISFSQDLTIYIRAGYPVLNIISSEEDRVLERIDEMRRDQKHFPNGRELFIWTVSRGWLTPDGQAACREETRDPVAALAFVRKFEGRALFLLKDFHPYLDDRQQNASLAIRAVRDLVRHLTGTGKTMLWVSPVLKIPPELEKDVTVLDMPLPTEAEYRAILDGFIDRYGSSTRVVFDLDEDGKDLIVKACQGLTKCEAENALAKSIVGKGRLTAEEVDSILSEKEQIIRKSGILEFWASVDSFGNVGGLASLKDWLRQRNQGFSQKARDFGLPYPRGVLLVGVPGCGKSLCAKAVAAEWKKPLLKFDLGRVYGSLVGESEERMRKALGVAEGVAPAILWIDELEKGLSGLSGQGDSGVSARIFGNLLTWMEEKSAPVFVVATANDITRLPPEFTRKGRFDEMFFVGLPNEQERRAIWEIHLKRPAAIAANIDIDELVRCSNSYTGAEIAEAVVSAMFQAFDDGPREVSEEDMRQALAESIPMSVSHARQIQNMIHWAGENAVPAS